MKPGKKAGGLRRLTFKDLEGYTVRREYGSKCFEVSCISYILYTDHMYTLLVPDMLALIISNESERLKQV